MVLGLLHIRAAYSQHAGVSLCVPHRGHSGLEEIDLQIDVWARDYDEAKAIAKAVRAAMPPSGPRFSAHLIEDQDLYEDGTNYFRVNMEFKVWFLETE